MNYLATASHQNSNSGPGQLRLVVIGGGPVGIRLVNDLLKQSTNFSIQIFSDERAAPYNRARLSQLLAGQVDRDLIDIQLHPDERAQLVHRAVADIDCEAKKVTDSQGQEYDYDVLVLATGARAYVPDLPGKELAGVYQFRSLRNTEDLLARKVKSRHVVVVGGGLLGIETAVAMNRFHTRVSLIHQGEHLLNRQLDQHAAHRLQNALEQKDISVFLNNGVRAIAGEQAVTHVRLRDGLEVECDTVILCCGSSPNIELARDAKIRVNKGIVVSDTLQTSQDNVFAIGECCEHSEQTYGLVSPGYEQAAVLVDRLIGGDAVYAGSEPQSLLKVLDLPLRSFGTPVNYRKTPFDKETVYQTTEQYIKLITTKSRIVGGIAVGDVDEIETIVDYFQRGEPLRWYRRLLLKTTGRLWPMSDHNDPTHWNEQRVVCRCQQVSVGQVNLAVADGNQTLPALGSAVQAGVTCGSCQPILAQLIAAKTGNKVALSAEPLWKSSLMLSIFAAIFISLMLLIPGLSVGDSVTQPAPLQSIWNDKFWKQVTGFSLLGMSVVGLLVSLRKRFKKFSLGGFAYWRFAHVTLGVLCAAGLMIHTGLHLGSNLNRWLVVNFIVLLTLGAFTSATIALSHRLQGRKQTVLRKSWGWLHIIAAWPLPVLLIAHIITVYKF